MENIEFEAQATALISALSRVLDVRPEVNRKSGSLGLEIRECIFDDIAFEAKLDRGDFFMTALT